MIVEAGHTVLPERLAMMLVRVLRGGKPHGTTRDRAGYDVGQSGDRPHGTTREAGYMMLVAVEVGHVVGHVLSISLVQ